MSPAPPVVFEAKYLCSDHVGDLLEIDYVQPHTTKPITLTGHLAAVLGSGSWTTLWLADSADVDADQPLVVHLNHDVSVTTRYRSVR